MLILFFVCVLQAVLQQSDSVTDRLREENEILKAQVWNYKVEGHVLIDASENFVFFGSLFFVLFVSLTQMKNVSY